MDDVPASVQQNNHSIVTSIKILLFEFKYHVNGKPHFVYNWRLEPTDTLPAGKKPCLSLRELEKQIGYNLDSLSDSPGKSITVGDGGAVPCSENGS